MARGRILSLSSRKIELKRLITDAVTLKFNPTVIREYKSQLLGVEGQLAEIKEAKARFKANVEHFDCLVMFGGVNGKF